MTNLISLAEIKDFLSIIKKANLPCLFISGDVHYSQIQLISKQVLGFETFEITSSAFFSNSAGNLGKRSFEEGQLSYYGKPNFLTLQQVNLTAGELNFDIFCISESSRRQFYNRINYKQG